MIATDVKFNNTPFVKEKNSKKRKRSSSQNELQNKEEEYDNELREQRYKMLMHLLNKSKFYSSYLINKFEDDKNKNKKKRGRKKCNSPINDENVPPKRKNKKMTKNEEKSKMQEYISTEVSSKILTFG